MADTSKIAKNLQAFQIALNAHDRENPDHTAYGIGLAHFDMERLGFDEGEEVLPGITIHGDSGVTGNFRVLCDGQHAEDSEEVEETEVVEAVAVARAEGAGLDGHVVLGELAELPDGQRSSLALDVAAGAEHELDAIAGAVLRAGARPGIPTPAVAELVALIRARYPAA